MKNLYSYEQWKLEEANKTVEFFKAHPELLSKYSTGDEKIPAKADIWDPRKNRIVDSNKDWRLKEKIQNQALAKFNKLGLDVEMTWPDKKPSDEPMLFSEWILGANRWSNYHSKEFMTTATQSKNATDFEANLKNQWIKLPSGSNNTWSETSVWHLLDPIWKKFVDVCKWTLKALDSANNASDKHFRNELMKLGLSMSDVKIAMTIVSEWTSMSRKRLDPSTWPLLKKMSVSEKLLPKYVYRGIFYDGAKIKDDKKFLEKWSEGSKPGASQGKATSWSIDRGTAASFMTDQDFIKDRKGGYYVLLKWKVDPTKVIADLRNLPVDHTFWNQQEIIVSPEARDYEVDTIIPGAEDETYREFSKTLSGQGAMGFTKKDFVTRQFLKIPYDTINVLDRIKWKELCGMTIAEANKAYDADLYISAIKDDPKFGDIALPIGIWLDRYGIGAAYEFIPVSRNELQIQIGLDLNAITYYNTTPEIKAWIEPKKKEIDYNPYSSNLIIAGVMSIKLISSTYYNMEFEIILPKKLELIKNPFEKKSTGESINIANEVFQEAWNRFGSDEFMKIFTNKATTINPPRNINYTIK